MKYLTFVLILLLVIALTSGFSIRSKRMIGGESVNNNETELFNFQVGLRIKTNNSVKFCGGSLISSEWILTAAHCTAEYKSLKAYLGSTQWRSGTKVQVLEVIQHNNYYARINENDISLLRIAPINLGKEINIIKLPSASNSSLNPEYLDESVIASGWGVNETKVISKNLKYIHMKIISNSECSKEFKKYRKALISSSKICGKGLKGSSICRGDSGGPLFTESTKTLIGITSFIPVNGCHWNSTNGFTRITKYRSWIFENTGI